ncbi:putative methyltransferase-domain-containing protein [Peziza echinospora]|nr:putative methyltransferase-domain-containing protein [Peziza echinospora]
MSPGATIVEDVEAPIDVLDLPHPSARPQASLLLEILSAVQVLPASWDPRGRKKKSIKPKSRYTQLTSNPLLSRWLTGLVSNGLSWVSDEDRERIWEEAGKRLAERCGRVAMPAITRGFIIPLVKNDPEEASSGDESMADSVRKFVDDDDDEEGVEGVDYVTINLHEPSMTSGNLGLKTWGSSLLLARKLATLDLPQSTNPEGMKTLELGSGTGLVGIACAAVLGAKVTLTDLPEIIPNLQKNVNSNLSTIRLPIGAGMEVETLDWTQPEESVLYPRSEKGKFQLVVAADALYSSIHPALVTNMIKMFLRKGVDSRALVEFPLRPRYEGERANFWRLAESVGLTLLQSGTEEGRDDWGSGETEEDEEDEDEDDDEVRTRGGKVRCWWGMYGWGDDVVAQTTSI